MDNIVFQSRIRPVSPSMFNKTIKGFGEKVYVDYPWTVRESVFSEKAYTKDVFDCSVCGITDGLKVLLLHICPTMEENENFLKIENFIKNTIDLKNPDLQGFVLGSKKMPIVNDYSGKLFDSFVRFLKKHKIPTTELKGGLHTHNVAYSSQTDEWLISTPLLANEEISKSIGAKNFLDKVFDKVKISKKDEVSW